MIKNVNISKKIIFFLAIAIIIIAILILILNLSPISIKINQQKQTATIQQKHSSNNKDLKTSQIEDNNLINDNLPKKVLHNVPFTAQAPFGGWDDVRQDYGCEEASILMAMYWVYDKKLTPEVALQEITKITEFEKDKYGHFHDTSAQDTLKLLKDYFDYDKAFVDYDININDIKKELAKGNLVIVPINGIKVGNPYYTPPGPFIHQIVIRGYNDNTQEFITNDPGTIKGEAYKYDYSVLENALMDYKTGLREPIEEIRTAMLVVEK